MRLAPENAFCLPIHWVDENWETDEEGIWESMDCAEVDLNVEQLLYVWFKEGNSPMSYFGASRGGKLYVSDIRWIAKRETEILIWRLLKNGSPPYEILEFIEL